MHLKSSTTCKNCNNQFEGKFCNNCGQKASVGTINFKDIFHEGWHNLTHTDTGYLQLFLDLLVRPGQTIKNYLAGQRKRYFSPFTFYIVTTSLLILATNWVFKKEDSTFQINDEIGNYVSKSLNHVLLFSLPFVTLLLWAFFKRHFKNTAEALTAVIFMFGAANFILLLCNLFFYIFIDFHYRGNSYAILISYFFMLHILYNLLKPLNKIDLLKLVFLVISFYILVEIIAKGILLLEFGVPINNLKLF